MCTNSRLIYNRYSRRSVLVPCGKCKACLQERASRRANRIRNNFQSGYIALFVTLTYTNNYVPFIRKSELKNLKEYDELNVYRSANCRYTFSRWNGLRFVSSRQEQVIERVILTSEMLTSLNSLKPLVGKGKDSVGVCIYKDVQDFFKRLRQYLKRIEHYEKNFTYFSCSEYGGVTQRPHFHSLIFVRKEDEQIFRRAVLTCWPYADVRRTQDYIELAVNPASYVASYVNSNISLPACLQNASFAPKSSMSKHFGVVLDCFNLPSLLSKIDQGDLHYYSKKKFDGTSCVDLLPIPKYVLNRFFPRFKGFGWLSEPQLYNILLESEKVYEYLCTEQQNLKISSGERCINIQSETDCLICNPLYNFTRKECHKICTSLNNAYEKFRDEIGLSRYDYAYYYLRAWKIYNSQVLKDSFRNVSKLTDYQDFYENGNELNEHPEWCPTLDMEFCGNPNERHDVVEKTASYMRIFDLCDKTKKVNNLFMSSIGHNV